MSITSVVLTKEQKSIIAEALEVMPEDLEEIKIKANSYKKTSFKDDFSMIFKRNIATLARMDLTPTAFRIVLYLFSVIDYGNSIPDFSQSRTARELGLNKSNVSRAFRELFERKIIYIATDSTPRQRKFNNKGEPYETKTPHLPLPE